MKISLLLGGFCFETEVILTEAMSSKHSYLKKNGVVVVQSLSRRQCFETTRTAARQASLSFTISQSVLKLMSIES